MAENPAQWGEATKIISDALERFLLQSMEMVGNTGAMQIAQALHRAGFLDHEDIWIDNPQTPVGDGANDGAWG